MSKGEGKHNFILNYGKIFRKATVPKIQDLRGNFIVCLAPPIFPKVRFFGHQKHFPTNAKSGGGFNQFLDRIKLGNFRLELGESTLGDGLNVLKIIYDHPSNPFLLRKLTDELREIKKGHYLGRGIYDVCGKKINIFYFTLQKV